MCREILSPIHEELAVSSGLDASDVWRCAGHGLYVQLPRTLSSTSGEHASKAICSSTRPPKWILWKPVESITDLITLLVMTRSKVTWIVRKIQIISLFRADTTCSRPPSWKFLNEGKLLRRRINNIAKRFTSYLSTNQRFLRPVGSMSKFRLFEIWLAAIFYRKFVESRKFQNRKWKCWATFGQCFVHFRDGEWKIRQIMGEANSSRVKLIQLDLQSYRSCDEIGFYAAFSWKKM